jgi:hypothetical protein
MKNNFKNNPVGVQDEKMNRVTKDEWSVARNVEWNYR